MPVFLPYLLQDDMLHKSREISVVHYGGQYRQQADNWALGLKLYTEALDVVASLGHFQVCTFGLGLILG